MNRYACFSYEREDVTIQTLISLASGNPVTPAVGQQPAVEFVLLNM